MLEHKIRKHTGYISKQGQRFKKFKDIEQLLFKADQQHILNFLFISFRRNILCLKNPPCNQVILKIVVRLSRLLAKKTQSFYIDNWNCFNMFLHVLIFCRDENFETYLLTSDFTYHYYFSLFFYQYFSPEMIIFFWVENFLLSWKFSLELRIFCWAETFPQSWEFFLGLEIFPRVENFPLGLRVFL